MSSIKEPRLELAEKKEELGENCWAKREGPTRLYVTKRRVAVVKGGSVLQSTTNLSGGDPPSVEYIKNRLRPYDEKKSPKARQREHKLTLHGNPEP